jgi:hypothetical protein
MPKVINRITIGTPTGLTPARATGGNLSVGTTYYYRVIAVQLYPYPGGNIAACFSQASAAVTVTPTSGNQTVNLTWSAVTNASGYILQRDTSGLFRVTDGNTFVLNGRPYGSQMYFTTQTSLTDNGLSGTSRVKFTAGGYDFSRPIPVIEVYATAGETITMSDVYDASVAGGWGDVDIIAPSAGWKAETNANWRSVAPYVIYGSLYVKDCTWQQRGTILSIGGHVYFSNTCKLDIGTAPPASSYTAPMLLSMGTPGISKTTDNDTFSNYFGLYRMLFGAADSKCYGLVQRLLNPTVHVGNYYAYCYDNGVGANVRAENCLLGLGSYGGWYPVYSPNVPDTVLESNRFQVPVDDVLVRYSGYGLCLYYTDYGNIRVRRGKVIDSPVDLCAGYSKGSAFVDCLWQAVTTVNTNPYCYWSAASATAVGNTALHCFSFGLQVSDRSGAAIAGATVTLTDARGNSALFQDSGAKFTSALNNTDTSSSLTVDDGSKFTIGNVIRLETYDEILLVTDKAGNTLTVTRGYQGTTKRATGTNAYSTAAQRVLVQRTALTTDADGKVDLEPLIHRVLETLRSDGGHNQAGYENDLVSQGWVGRTYLSPYTFRVEKAGYETYTDVITLTEKKVLDVALSPVPSPVYLAVPSGEFSIEAEAPATLDAALSSPQIEVTLQ